MGRPRKYEDGLVNFISTALNARDSARFERAAYKSGKTKSELLRELLLEYCKKIEESGGNK